MGVLDRRGGGGLNVTVDASPSVDVHRPRSLSRASRRASPYGRSPHEAARHNKLPPLPQQLAPTLPTPGTQLSHAIGGLALAPISSRTRRATKAWAQPAAARHGRSPARQTAQASGGGAGAEFEAYLKLHGFTTERTPEEKRKRTKGKTRAAAPHAAAPSHAVRGGDGPGVVASVPPVVPPLELVPQPPKQVGFNPNLVPRPPPPEAVPARLAAVRAARGKRRLPAETLTVTLTLTRARIPTLILTVTLARALTLSRLRAETVTPAEEQQHSAEQVRVRARARARDTVRVRGRSPSP